MIVGLFEKVTQNMSVFTKGDLKRATKYIEDKEVRERLIESAISDESIRLFQEIIIKKIVEYYTVMKC